MSKKSTRIVYIIGVFVLAVCVGCSKSSKKEEQKNRENTPNSDVADGGDLDEDAGDLGEDAGDLSEDSDTAAAEEIDTEEVLINQRVEEYLESLSPSHKAGQMVQAQFSDARTNIIRESCLGSVFNGGEEPVNPNNPTKWADTLDTLQAAAMDGCGIPIFYGIDAVHGNAKVSGATVFPHNIGLGASRDATLVEQVGIITGKECRAVGVHLTFAPAVSVVRDERWGRTYEGFGETPEVNAEMGAAMIRGLQGMGNMLDPGAVAATAKHYVGDGGTTDGKNNGFAIISEQTMRDIHLPPYAAAVTDNVAAVMPSYHQWTRDGQTFHMTQDTFSVTNILRQELGFKGFVLSDYDAISRVEGGINAKYTHEKVAAAVNAGVDMAMIAVNGGMTDFIDAILNGQITETRIDDAVRRILKTKIKLGLFESPFANRELLALVGSAEHQTVAREAVQKSLVLLRNEGAALPLAASEPVILAGPYANMMGAQAGGWTISWQGDKRYGNDKIVGETILQGLQQVSESVVWDENGENLTGATKVVVVVGESPYSEGNGDHGETVISDNSTASVYLKDQPNYGVLERAIASGAQVILVILSGRPLIIEPSVVESVDAIVAAWLPGSKGIGVADVLFGNVGFTGTLPHTWPASFDQIPINIDKKPDEPGVDPSIVPPLYPYGHGLTYL